MKKTMVLVALVITMVLITLFHTSCAPQKKSLKWVRNTETIAENLNSVTFGNGLYVAVGDNGTIKTSASGVKWVRREQSTTASLNKVIWNGQKFLSIGNDGVVLLSDNGLKWTQKVHDKSIYFNSVIWDDKRFIAVGWKRTKPSSEEYQGVISESIDGVTWKHRFPSSIEKIKGIAFDGKKYVITANYQEIIKGSGVGLLYSQDAEKWFDCKALNFSLYNDFGSIIWNGKQFLAGSFNNIIFTSSDGVEWKQNQVNSIGSFHEEIYWSGTMYVCKNGDTIMTSLTGLDWQIRKTIWPAKYVGGFTWGKNQFVAVGGYGLVYTSAEGKQWQERVSGQSRDLYDVIWDGRQFVAAGGDMTIMSSTDGKRWSFMNDDNNQYHSIGGIIWNEKGYVAVANFLAMRSASGSIAISSNGKKWSYNYEESEEDEVPALYDVAWNGKTYLAVGNSFMTSVDRYKWTALTGNVPKYAYAVIWDGKSFITVGGKSISISADGSKWTTINLKAECFLNNIVYTGKEYVAVGVTYDDTPESLDLGTAIVVTSKDGKEWSEHRLSSFPELKGIAWNGSTFIAVGLEGTILESVESYKWTKSLSGVADNLNNIVWNGKQFIIVGNYGTILRSESTRK